MTVPDWLLERYALGEVTDAERARVEADPDLQAQLDALAVSDAEVRQTYDGAVVARRARARATPSRSTPRGWWIPLAAAVAAVLLYVSIPPDDGHRAKGGDPALVVHRQIPGGSEPVSPGASLPPGTVVQLEAIRGSHDHGWLVSIDGRGAVTLHNEGVLEPGASLLPTGYRLDDAPRFEHFWLVVSDAPIAREVVEAAARAAPAAPGGKGVVLDLPDAREFDVWVRKP